ncbi:MAG TPA: lysophospholipid acyltransferase family protein [Fibrobacteria bacterium]|nr:lysophospholipid acyltransferase family protein [Fibrobacteria bacterium]
MSLLWRMWRTAATVMCFAVFAMGGALIGAFGIPCVWLIWRKEEARHRVGRWIVQKGFHLFVLLMRGTGVIHVRYEGLESLRRSGNLVLANHPTLIDFVLLASVIPQADCFVKSALLGDWFKRWPVLLAGYIPNDQGESTMARCRRSLASGNNVIIFPEGTRTPPGMPVKFRKGAAQVAVRTQRNVTPVFIESTRSNLHKGGAWYLAPRHQVRITLRVKDDIPIRPFLTARPDQPALAARDLNDHLQHYFNKDLSGARA